MSSRALRRLQKDSDLDFVGLAAEEQPDSEEESDVEVNIVACKSKKKKKKGKQAPLNPFELLDDGTEENGEENDKEDSDASQGQVEVMAEKVTPKTKKKKKSKKKQRENENGSPSQGDQETVEDEVEASLQEVNRLLGEATGLSVQGPSAGGDSASLNMKPLLHIDYRNLNPETELKKMFGSQVVRGEQRQERNRRQRNRPTQRSSKLVQPKENWHPTGGSGLSMKYLGESEGFMFDHSPQYQRLQHEFLNGVDSSDPGVIVSVLRKHPYHIDSLMQMAEFHRINEEFQTAAEFIEKALYGMECAFHPMFNIAAGNCHLPYNRPENRPFYLCLFKHILNLGRRGCNRTAFEFCKLLLSLDPSDDPMDCMSMLDFYALRSDQYEFLLRLQKEALSLEASKQVPNFAFSIALANFKESLKREDATSGADDMLQDALLFFPVMLMPLLDQCSVHPDKRVTSHPFFNTKELLDNTSELERLVRLYVKRCDTCWKEPEVMSWLERNVQAVLDIVDAGRDRRIHDYAEIRKKGFRKPPLSLLRHYFLSEIQGVSPPQRFTSGPVLSYDPFPPPDTIISYTKPARQANASSESTNSLLRAFFESINPAYNPNEPAEARNQRRLAARNGHHNGNDDEGATGGGAIPAQIQDSVNAMMDAMRNLLRDPFANLAGRPAEGEGHVDDNNDGEWEDEQEGHR